MLLISSWWRWFSSLLCLILSSKNSLQVFIIKVSQTWENDLKSVLWFGAKVWSYSLFHLQYLQLSLGNSHCSWQGEPMINAAPRSHYIVQAVTFFKRKGLSCCSSCSPLVMLRCSTAPTFLSKDTGRSVKESMQRCTRCAALAQCKCHYQNVFHGSFGVLQPFMEKKQKAPGLKESRKWFRVERV